MRIRKKFKKSGSAQRAVQWFHDNPGAKVAAVAKRFGLSIPYVYKLRDKAAGKTEPLVTQDEARMLLRDTDTNEGRTTTILESRAKDYGTFRDNARLAQALKRAMADHADDMGSLFADDQWEALEMIATKMSRIVNGDPNKADTWDDIAGYAQLVADGLRGVVR